MNWKDLDRGERIELADEIAASLTKTGSLGERIKILRTIYCEKQGDFAKWIGVSRSYLSEVENEKGKPSIEMVVGIANSFTFINNNWLLTGEGSVHIPIKYDENGWSISPERNIDFNSLFGVIRIIEDSFGGEWLCKQNGARRKAEILSYFYEVYVSAYRDAEVSGVNNSRKCREQAESACLAVVEKGLPSVRHKRLEE
jgi:DNA-binding XRE family transcriptional regulator